MPQRWTKREIEERIDRVIRDVRSGLERGRPVRRALPYDGVAFVERPLPLLYLHRRPERVPDRETDRLVMGLPPFIIAGAGTPDAQYARVATKIARVLAHQAQAVCMVELCELPYDGGEHATSSLQVAPPRFRLAWADEERHGETVDRLVASLESRPVAGQAPELERVPCAAEDLGPALGADVELPYEVMRLRIELRPIYRDYHTGHCYPKVLAELCSALQQALEDALHVFARQHSSIRPPHPRALGRTTLSPAAEDVDATLMTVSERLDFLLNVTPANLLRCWREFAGSGYERAPCFEYRPLSLDPLVLKRWLFGAPFEQIEDPAVLEMLRQLVEEYDAKLSMLDVRGTPGFLHGSVRVFGKPSERLKAEARAILARSRDEESSRSEGGVEVDALDLLRRVRVQLERYRARDPTFPLAAEIRSDVVAGVMVSNGRVLIQEELVVSRRRALALIAHEVDTHVLTFHNGRGQRLHVLGSGLSSYEATQEGMALFSEYLVGGLDAARLFVIAARVIGVAAVIDGASFVEVFRLLHREHGMPARDAYWTTARIFRGGGLTKDAVYLRGLLEVLDYLRAGGDLGLLWLGKIALEQVPLLAALRQRGIVRQPKLLPPWLERGEVIARLERARACRSVAELQDG